MPRRQKAFSLIEMMIVVAILGITAGAVALNLASPVRRAKMEDVIGRIAAFDNIARSYARANDRPLVMTVNVSDGILSRAGRDGGFEGAATEKLPKGFSIDRLLVGAGETTYGSASIQYGSLGMTPTYAMLLKGPQGQSQWIVVAGLTGEVALVKDEAQIHELFKLF